MEGGRGGGREGREKGEGKREREEVYVHPLLIYFVLTMQ